MDDGATTPGQIKSFVERILALKAEIDTVNDLVKDVYAEARANGYDKTVLGKVVSYVRKREKSADAVSEQETLFDLYLAAFDTPSRTHVHAREEAPRAEAQKPAERPTVTVTAKDGAGNTLATAGPVSIDTFIAAAAAPPRAPEAEPEMPDFLRRPKPTAPAVPA